MNTAEFEVHRNERIRQLRDAYRTAPDRYAEEPETRRAWDQLRANWQAHAEQVKTYAEQNNIASLMGVWAEIVRDSRFRNEHEGIGLNSGLTTENIREILEVSQTNQNMYWLTHHLKQHPNYQP